MNQESRQDAKPVHLRALASWREHWNTRFMESFDLRERTRIGAMNLPQWRVSVLDCASPLALSMTHDLQSGLPHSKTWRSCQRFMERWFGARKLAAKERKEPKEL
jgi:hypothetical protein